MVARDYAAVVKRFDATRARLLTVDKLREGVEPLAAAVRSSGWGRAGGGREGDARDRRVLAGRADGRLELYPTLDHLFIAGEGPSTPAAYMVPGRHVDAQV